jgi:hypothetical protein
MALTKQFRSPNSPSPIYGIRPGFNVGDFERQATVAIATIPSTSASVAAPTAISPHARAVKISVNVTAGSGNVSLTVKSAVDNFTATVATYNNLALGTYDFYLGGWASPSGDSVNGSYLATQYGPVAAGSSPAVGNTTGDEDTVHPDPSADSNYTGGTYNPVLFLSLDGYDLKVSSVVVGTVTYDVEVTPIS